MNGNAKVAELSERTFQPNCPSKVASCCTELVTLLSTVGIQKHTFAFIGGGKIAKCLLEGMIAAGVLAQECVAISVRSEASKLRWTSLGYDNVFTDNHQLLSRFGKGVVFLAVKPQHWQSLVADLPAGALSEAQLIISLIAGKTVSALQKSLPYYCQGFVRLMPNTPAALGAGAFVVCSDKNAAKKVAVATYLAESMGLCVVVEEQQFDAATAIAGCGPAFIFTVIDAIADGGVMGGLSRAAATKLAAQTVMGAAKMVLTSEEHPGTLKDNVCSPAGATIAGIRSLERSGVRSSFIEAVCASTERSRQL